MSKIKAWVLSLLPLPMLAALFWPWHPAATIPAIPDVPAAVETAKKIEEQWHPVIMPASPFPAPTSIAPTPEDALPASADGQIIKPAEPLQIVPPTRHKAKPKPRRHRTPAQAGTPPTDNSWPAQALRATARRAGQIQ